MTKTVLSAQLRRHRRLLALCGLSALVHLALLDWFAGAGGAARAPAPATPAPEDLVLRLMPAPAARRAEAGAGTNAAAAQPPAPARAQAQPMPQPQLTPLPSTTPAPAPVATAAAQAPAAAPVTASGQPLPQAAPDAGADAPVQMPGRYRVRMPDAVLLTYVQTRQTAFPGAPQRLPDAHLDWRSDGERYALTVDGVLGRLSSRGGSGDAGVRPRSAAEERDGRQSVTEFADGAVRFGDSGRSLPDSTGIQDRASLLMQLAGIGLGEPDQVQAQESVDVVVAGALEATVERFQVIGRETLATPLGAIEAWHLAQRAAPGRPRLEVWLAPGRGWLPVQLRLTGVDGAAATQTVSAIAAPAGAPPG